MPSRRAAITRVAGTLGFGTMLAGCVGDERRSTATRTETATEGSTATETATATPPARLSFGEPYESDSFTVVPTGIDVQSAFVHLRNVDHGGVVGSARWFCFVTVSGDGTGLPSPADFGLRFGGGRRRGWTSYEVRERAISVHRDVRAYLHDEDATTGWIGVTVPYDVADPALELVRDGEPVARWSLPGAAVDRLQSDPPAFTVESVTAPETASPEEPFDVEVTVRNDGGAGTFRGVLNYTRPLYAYDTVAGRVDTDATATVVHSVTLHTSSLFGDDTPFPVRGTLESVGGEADFSVEIE